MFSICECQEAFARQHVEKFVQVWSDAVLALVLRLGVADRLAASQRLQQVDRLWRHAQKRGLRTVRNDHVIAFGASLERIHRDQRMARILWKRGGVGHRMFTSKERARRRSGAPTAGTCFRPSGLD
jgi:hypothetical protein